MSEDQSRTDRENSSFWDELCGTGFARSLGIERVDAEALCRFDDAYMRFYPYLWDYVRPRFDGRRVLEIGLGFGTLGHLISSRGAEYHAVDIALGPVRMMQRRLRDLGRRERALRVSALSLPYPDGAFDEVYSIGCIHHTGNLPGAIREVRRVLKVGGRAVVMVYNAYSLRRLLETPIGDLLRGPSFTARSSASERARYGASVNGEAAPHTAFVSTRQARRIFAGFAHVKIEKRNCDEVVKLKGRIHVPRARLLGTVGRRLGLDLYVVAER
jgi:SAM-dependent methyltransferase